MDGLSVDVLSLVFANLDRADLPACALVSRTWLKLARRSLYNDIRLSHYHQAQDYVTALTRHAHLRARVNNLCVWLETSPVPIDQDFLYALLYWTPHIRRLRIVNLPATLAPDNPRVLSQLTQLKCFTAELDTRLGHLDFGGPLFLSIVSRWPELESLDIVPKLAHFGIGTFFDPVDLDRIQNASPRLTHLGIPAGALGAQGLTPGSQSLRVLRLHQLSPSKVGTYDTTRQAIRTLAVCPLGNLDTIVISRLHPQSLYEGAMKEIEEIGAARGLAVVVEDRYFH